MKGLFYLIIIAIIIGLLVIYLLRGYMEHERFYYQALALLYIERNGWPLPKSDDFEASKVELDERKWDWYKEFMIYSRFPFKHIPGKYLPF